MRITDLFLVVPAIAILAIALKKFGGTREHDHPGAVVPLLDVRRPRRARPGAVAEGEGVHRSRARVGRVGPTDHRAPHRPEHHRADHGERDARASRSAIITESTLSFLGFGVQPPQTSWGNMLSDAEGYVGTPQAYLLYAPGIMILITVLARELPR